MLAKPKCVLKKDETMRAKLAAVYILGNCEQQPLLLTWDVESAESLLQCVADMLKVPISSPTMVDFLLSVNQRLPGGNLSEHRSVLAFFTDLGVSDMLQVQLARTSYTATPVASFDSKCHCLAHKLGWSQTVLHFKINSARTIVDLKCKTIDAYLESLESLAFRSENVIKSAQCC